MSMTPLHRYTDCRWLRGFNVVPSWGARIEQAWWDYDPNRFREEVALARGVHANCIRLWVELRHRLVALFADERVTERPCRTMALHTPRLRRLVSLFTDAGLHGIEGGHVAGPFRAGDYRTSLGGLPAGSVEGHAVLAPALRKLHEVIAANGWVSRWLQHTADEPRGDAAATAWRN